MASEIGDTNAPDNIQHSLKLPLRIMIGDLKIQRSLKF